MSQINKEFSVNLWKKITYGINLSFNRLIDEKRKNNEEFVFLKDGKIVYVNAHDVEYRKLD